MLLFKERGESNGIPTLEGQSQEMRNKSDNSFQGCFLHLRSHLLFAAIYWNHLLHFWLCKLYPPPASLFSSINSDMLISTPRMAFHLLLPHYIMCLGVCIMDVLLHRLPRQESLGYGKGALFNPKRQKQGTARAQQQSSLLGECNRDSSDIDV